MLGEKTPAGFREQLEGGLEGHPPASMEGQLFLDLGGFCLQGLKAAVAV